ncbi:MAG TPA: VOC family protein [Solirubrobacteraceae bacterium]|jgi:predicted enzyme related to lactoylglutathione lyase|nr:VOC family protein [Solirubrobacteraceae bacterium]
MLGAHPLNPILPAQDGARAEAFYRDALGLRQLSPPGGDPMVFAAGGATTLALTELPDRVPPSYPVIAFMVSGIEQLVRDLTARGVSFVEPGASSFQGREGTIGGAITDYGAVRSAWLRDSEGNILALNEIVTA